MNQTLSQAFERTKDLAGEIKAAVSVLADCEAKEAEQANLAEIAGKATVRAKERLDALYAERDTLADHMRELALKVGEPQPTSPAMIERPDIAPDPFAAFGHPAKPNGADPYEGAPKQ